MWGILGPRSLLRDLLSRPNVPQTCSTESHVSSGCRGCSLSVVGSHVPSVHIVVTVMEIIVINMEITKP